MVLPGQDGVGQVGRAVRVRKSVVDLTTGFLTLRRSAAATASFGTGGSEADLRLWTAGPSGANTGGVTFPCVSKANGRPGVTQEGIPRTFSRGWTRLHHCRVRNPLYTFSGTTNG